VPLCLLLASSQLYRHTVSYGMAHFTLCFSHFTMLTVTGAPHCCRNTNSRVVCCSAACRRCPSMMAGCVTGAPPARLALPPYKPLISMLESTVAVVSCCPLHRRCLLMMAGCVTGDPPASPALTQSLARGRWLECTGTTTVVSQTAVTSRGGGVVIQHD
jgi:hypothetical protein